MLQLSIFTIAKLRCRCCESLLRFYIFNTAMQVLPYCAVPGAHQGLAHCAEFPVPRVLQKALTVFLHAGTLSVVGPLNRVAPFTSSDLPNSLHNVWQVLYKSRSNDASTLPGAPVLGMLEEFVLHQLARSWSFRWILQTEGKCDCVAVIGLGFLKKDLVIWERPRTHLL